MSLRLYNTLSRRIEAFVPLQPPQVGLYTCGPTVYDDPHLGHLRSAFVFDLLRRHLTARGFHVRFIRNVTDVDDKIIDKARQEVATSDKRQVTKDLKKACQEVAEKYLKSYHEALAMLGIEPPTVEPKATAHVVPEMTDLIAKLLLDGTAYEAGGDVYFAVRKFAGYGRLSNRSVDDLQAGARVEPGEQKRDPMDFALWKSAKPEEPSWSSPWGDGRPGWHIECSAMSGKYLGDTFDIHGGGLDLIFPHHENEIAQSQAAGRPFAKVWMHHGLVTVNGEKMSKSLGNFVTIEKALEMCQPDVTDVNKIKMLFLSTHYRSPLDFSITNLNASSGRLHGLRAFLEGVEKWRNEGRDLITPDKKISDLQDEFQQAMDDDLNTPEALAVLDKLAEVGWQYQNQLNLRGPKAPDSVEPIQFRRPVELDSTKDQAMHAANAIRNLGGKLGLQFESSNVVRGHLASGKIYTIVLEEKLDLKDKVESLLKQREIARQQKNFKIADQIRQDITALGFIVEDIPGELLVRPKR